MNKKELDKMKPSAYKSMWLAKEGKGKGENKGKLKLWIEEEWLNLNSLYKKGKEIPCGQKYKGQKEPTVCRPKYDKSNNEHDTPRPLAYDLTKKKVEKAISIKKQGKRIDWKKL